MLYDEYFYKVLFDHLPVIVLVLDMDRRVHFANRYMEKMFGCNNAAIDLQQYGVMCKCIFAKDSGMCGYTRQCEKCVLKNALLRAFTHHAVTNAKGHITTQTAQGMRSHNLLITATPINISEEMLVLMTFEDLSSITQLNGLLPICSSCKRIRTAEGLWLNFEQYIEKHSEAQFTHDCCPDCLKRVYQR